MKSSGRAKLAIPYPVSVAEPIVVDELNVRIAIRGLAATPEAISFVVQVVVVADKDDRTRGATLSAGAPFNMPHETPDPDALTVRCQWHLQGHQENDDDSELVKAWGGGPLEQGGWSGGLDIPVWQGFFLLRYPVAVPQIETFTIALSWNRLGISTVRRVILASALEEALGFAMD